MTATNTTARPPLGRSFLTLWSGQTASMLGTDVSAAGVSIAAFVETGSVWWLSILYLAVRLPGLLVASHAGELVDRSDRRRVLVAADAAAGIATAVAIGLLLAGRLELWHLVLVAVVGSAANAYQGPAYASALPLLVPRGSIARAHGLLQLGPAIGLLVGPAIAGALVGVGGIGAVLAFDAVTFLLAVGATTAVRIPSPAPAAAESAPRQARAADTATGPAVSARGLRATWRSLTGRLEGLRHLLLFAAALNVVLAVVNVLLFALLLPLTGEAGAGLLLSVGGLAMLATAATVSARGVPTRRVRALSLTTVAVGAGIVLTGLRPSPVVVGLGLAVTLGGAALVSALAGTLFQTEVAADRQGRLSSLRRVVAEALTPLAVLGVAPLAQRLAEPAMQPTGALAGSLGAVLGTGPGRGVALLFVVVGCVVAALGAALGRDRALGRLDLAAPAAPQPEDLTTMAA